MLIDFFPFLYSFSNEEEDASRNRPIRLTTIKAVSSDPTAGEVTYGLKFQNLTKWFEIDANRGTLQVSLRQPGKNRRKTELQHPAKAITFPKNPHESPAILLLSPLLTTLLHHLSLLLPHLPLSPIL